jgi:hypothetical protein
MTATARTVIVLATTLARKGLVMHPHPTSFDLRVCSICLRVLVDGTWVAPETIILELRSFEHPAPPRFQPALCATCEESIIERRAQPAQRLAA